MLLNRILDNPLVGLIVVLAILLVITVHEFAHAWAANLLGDDTAESLGRLSLNPLPHIDGFGMLMLLLVGFGWGKPVPINPYNFKNMKRDSGLVAAAGPLSNLIFAGLCILVFKFFLFSGVRPDSLVYVFLIYLILINITLMLFNLLPIPPLDGSKVLFSVLPYKYQYIQLFLESKGPMLLLGLLILDSFSPVPIFGTLFSGIQSWVIGLL